MKKFRLAILTSHPIQYQAPLFRKLAQHPAIDLMVYFCSDQGVTEKVDREFMTSFKWDLPLLEGYRYKFLKNYSPWPSIFQPFRLINPGIWGELKRRPYDALLVHGYSTATVWLTFFAAWSKGGRLILRGESNLLYPRPWWVRAIKRLVLRTLFKRVQAFLTIGTLNAEFYLHYRVPAERLFLAPYSVDNEYFMRQAATICPQREATKGELGIPQGMPVILYCGKLVARKRPGDLLKAFEQLSREAALLLVGDGPERPKLEQYARQRGLKNVHFLGFQNQGDLPRFYGIADIFVLPSERDPWGLVLNEAMCYGLPVIATDLVGASRDLIRPGENGFIYPVGDIGALVSTLQNLLDDSEKRKAMGRSSLKLISDWNYETCVETIIDALKYLTEHSRN